MGLYAQLRQRLHDPVYGNGLALAANAGISAALGFAFWFIVARRFHPDALGIGAAVVSAATLAALVGRAGFDAALIRYAPASSPQELRRLVGSTAVATLGLTGIVAAVVLALATTGVPSLEPLLHPLFAFGFLALALATAGAWVLDALFIAQQRATRVLVRNLVFNGTKIVVPLFIAFELGGRAVPLAWAIGAVASLLVALAFLRGTFRDHAPTGERPERHAWGYAMRNYAINLSEFLPGLVLPLLVLDALGPEENARFYLAWSVATVAFLASKAVAQSTFAALVRDANTQRVLAKGALLSAALLGPALLAVALGAPLLLGLYGPHYADAAPLLRLLALSFPFVVATNLYLALLKTRDGIELTILPVASLVALLAILPFALATWGIVGTGLAWLAVQATAGTYATVRLLAHIWRKTHARARVHRHSHQG